MRELLGVQEAVKEVVKDYEYSQALELNNTVGLFYLQEGTISRHLNIGKGLYFVARVKND